MSACQQYIQRPTQKHKPKKERHGSISGGGCLISGHVSARYTGAQSLQCAASTVSMSNKRGSTHAHVHHVVHAHAHAHVHVGFIAEHVRCCPQTKPIRVALVSTVVVVVVVEVVVNKERKRERKPQQKRDTPHHTSVSKGAARHLPISVI